MSASIGTCGRCDGEVTHDGTRWLHVKNGLGLGECHKPRVYDGDYLWAMKRNDLDPPAYMHLKSEKDAREWYESSLGMAKGNLPDDPHLWPELVRSRLTWEVIE